MTNTTNTAAQATKKITLATIKSFIKRNEGKLFICTHSSFDGMTDCVQSTGERGFSPLTKCSHSTPDNPSNMGYNGVWFVRGSRDYFNAIERDGFTGYEISNCCGSWSIAIRK